MNNELIFDVCVWSSRREDETRMSPIPTMVRLLSGVSKECAEGKSDSGKGNRPRIIRSKIALLLLCSGLYAILSSRNSRRYRLQLRIDRQTKSTNASAATDVRKGAVAIHKDAGMDKTDTADTSRIAVEEGDKAQAQPRTHTRTMHTDEPYLNRWQRRFSSSKSRNEKGGYLFFRHTRKAGGTSLRDYFRDVMLYHNITRTMDDWKAIKDGQQTPEYQVHYIEHEFLTLDWQCPHIDPRWRESIRIVVLRHPIERHLSEFFFSGSGKKYFPIDRKQIPSNTTYTEEVKSFISINLPKWLKRQHNRGKKESMEGQFNGIFGRYYTDNFQLRALSGCASGECLKDKNVTEEQMKKINELHPSTHSYLEPVPRCTHYFRKEDTTGLFETCAKHGHIKEYCSIGCSGPCFYPSVAWGELSRKDLDRAISTLKHFDAIVLMEDMNDQVQSDFLSE